MEDLFRSGTLEMSVRPVEGAAEVPVWGDFLSNRILAVIAVALLVMNLAGIFRLIPVLNFSFRHTRGAATLEHSLGTARTRNVITLCLMLPFCLIADHYALFHPRFWDSVPPEWSALALLAGLSALLLLRSLCFGLWHPQRLGTEESAAVRHMPYNYFILLTCLMLVSRFLLPAFGVPDSAIRSVLYVEIALSWGLSLFRSVRFLASYGADFSTILYLCGLEILPAALVLATMMFF